MAAVEMAVLLPFLCFVMAATLDYARVLNFAVITASCARNGAIYTTNPSASPYPDLASAALADYEFSTNRPTVASSTGTDSYGIKYTKVTVTYSYKSILNYPGIPQDVTIGQSVCMPLAP